MKQLNTVKHEYLKQYLGVTSGSSQDLWALYLRTRLGKV